MENEIFELNYTAYLPGVSAVVTWDSTKADYSKPDATPANISTPKGEIKMVPWGENNNLPIELVEKVYKNPIVAQGMNFNTQLTYGDGILPVRRKVVNSKVEFEPVYDNAEINEFFQNTDISGYLLEQITDLSFFYNIFPEIVLNLESKRKIVELNHLEAVFSRWSEMDATTKKIEYHLYSAKFGVETPKKEEVVVTKALNPKNPLLDLKRRLGLEPWQNGVKKAENENRYVIPISMPTPGHFYYNKPYWISIIESGWYDFAQQIPEFKKALMKNQMTIKYHIELSDKYWEMLFASEGIKNDDDKKTRRTKELKDIQDFLTDTQNTGKSIITYRKLISPDGKEISMCTIKVLENNFKGGEYIDDLEEVSNILAYGMGIHPSLIGAAPGKNKNINGTEARELFIIKQALLKPIRDRLLMPLYIVKAINGWPDDIYFTIPNLELTTLDKGTGSQKVIS